MATLIRLRAIWMVSLWAASASGQTVWSGYGGNAQHTALSAAASQPLNGIHWSAPVDPNAGAGPLFIHFGSPSITSGNTVLVPVTPGAASAFQIEAFNGATGALLYTLQTDYLLPAHDWTPPYGATLARIPAVISRKRRIAPLNGPRPRLKPRERYYYPGAGGTVWFRDQPDFATGTPRQFVFYGASVYNSNTAAMNAFVQISTPIVADTHGNIYFGFLAQKPNPANLTSGIARITPAGEGSWASAASAAGGDPAITQVALNCAPALSNDGSVLYFAVSNGAEYGNGYLVSVDSTTLAPLSHTYLSDPRGGPATISSDSSASPMIGPDGDVYFGVLETDCCESHHDRGWLLHFDSTLTQTKIPGSFGWDDTASVVPANIVPSYTGASSYLVLTKYNNYAEVGGDGVNKVAVLDPEASQPDEYGTDVPVMREVITVTGVTPDSQPGVPNAVREWCINTAAVDPFTKSAIVNSEDGVVYRWDFATNQLTKSQRLTNGLGEAYTPTLIGPDGTVYAINDATLFAIGQ